MRAAIAIFASFLATTGAFAQEDSGPFTRWEAEQLRDVWSDIRTAESFGHIDWDSIGLDEAPGDAEARRLMDRHWGALRRAERFDDIDWEATTDYRASSRSLFEQRDRAWQDRERSTGPFTTREAEEMREVWSEIRKAASFEQIDWESVDLGFAPGDREARSLMARHWDELRRAERFDDIDWEATTGYSPSSEGVFGRQDRDRDRQSRYASSGPFTSREAQVLSDVWPEIRRAERFEEIDWGDVGLEVAPGDWEARTLMARHWDALRRADRFTDIDWQATTGFRDR